MPNIVKKAAGDRRRVILGFLGIYAIAGAEVAFAVGGLRQARTALDVAPPIVVILIATAVVVAAHASMRGAWADLGTSPQALLDTLERRHAARRRMGRLLPWITGAAIAATLAVSAAVMIAARRFDAGLAATAAGAGALTAVFVGWVVRRERRKIDRDLGEIAEARRLLSEDDPAA